MKILIPLNSEYNYERDASGDCVLVPGLSLPDPAAVCKDKNVKEVLTAVTAAPAGRNTVADTKEDGKVSGENGNEERDGDEGIDIDADSDDGSAFGDLFG